MLKNNSHIRNTNGLEQYRKKIQIDCAIRVDNTIEKMLKNKEVINFNTVCEKANVSKKYLYDHYFKKISEIRSKQDKIRPKQVKQQMTDNSKDVLLAAKNKRIKELETEVERLKDIIKRKYSEEYDQL